MTAECFRAIDEGFRVTTEDIRVPSEWFFVIAELNFVIAENFRSMTEKFCSAAERIRAIAERFSLTAEAAPFGEPLLGLAPQRLRERVQEGFGSVGLHQEEMDVGVRCDRLLPMGRHAAGGDDFHIRIHAD